MVAVAPAGTVAEATGTGSKTLLLERETAVPPAGAALLRVIVQVLKPAEFRIEGVQVSEEREGDVMEAVRLKVTAWEAAPSVAVRAAL